MVSIITNEDFMMCLREAHQASGLVLSRFAKNHDILPATFKLWVTKGVPTDKLRQRAIDKLPAIFSSKEKVEGEAPRVLLQSAQPTRASRGKTPAMDLHGALRIELARRDITALSETFRWFLLHGTVEDREAFRASVGEEAWPLFCSAVRAMTGEAALKITLEEGALKGWEQR